MLGGLRLCDVPIPGAGARVLQVVLRQCRCRWDDGSSVMPGSPSQLSASLVSSSRQLPCSLRPVCEPVACKHKTATSNQQQKRSCCMLQMHAMQISFCSARRQVAPML